MSKPHENPHDLFWKKVNKTEGCWEWSAGLTVEGYGKFSLTLPRPSGLTSKQKTPQRVYIASRYSWEITNGPITDGLFVCHKCDNPKCVRPDHLFLGTQKDNRVDAANKKRTAWGERSPHAKLSEAQVQEIRTLKESVKRAELAKRFGVSTGAIDGILSGRNWRHLGAS